MQAISASILLFILPRSRLVPEDDRELARFILWKIYADRCEEFYDEVPPPMMLSDDKTSDSE